MIKILSSKKKNFIQELDKLISNRKNKVQSDSVLVKNIIKDVKKNGDKALLKYEKKFNKNFDRKLDLLLSIRKKKSSV